MLYDVTIDGQYREAYEVNATHVAQKMLDLLQCFWVL